MCDFQERERMGKVPQIRVAAMNSAPVREDGDHVVYWMIAFRRTRWNFALDRAIEWARDLKKPLVVLDALRCDYQWASDRITGNRGERLLPQRK